MASEKQEIKFTFEPLGEQHDRAAFSCGVEILDSYLKKQAMQDFRKFATAPFVATPDGKIVAGYHTLAQYAIDIGDVPEKVAKKLPKYPAVPTTLLGRLARSNEFKRTGLGELLIMDALKRSLDASRQAASVAVVVDAKTDEVAEMYRMYGFLDLPRVERRLFLPMKTIKDMFA